MLVGSHRFRCLCKNRMGTNRKLPRFIGIFGISIWGIAILKLSRAEEFNITSDDEEPVSNEARLVADLLARYSRRGYIARPLHPVNESQPLVVEWGLRMIHMDIDEKNQLMETSVWIRAQWHDDYLRWDRDDYGGVGRVVLPATSAVGLPTVWIPDIELVNTEETKLQERRSDLSVRADGRVFWVPHRKYRSGCLIDITNYPFDRHICHMWFQSLSYSEKLVSLKPYFRSPLDLDTYLSSFKESQEWEVINNDSRSFGNSRDGGMLLMWSRRVSLRFTIEVARRPGFKAYFLLVPCALLAFCATLVFVIPPDRNDRNNLALSLFASFTILLLLLQETAPASAAGIPRLAIYYFINMFVLIAATCLSVLIINISRRGELCRPVPAVICKIFLGKLGLVLGLGDRLALLHASQGKRDGKTGSSSHTSEPRHNDQDSRFNAYYNRPASHPTHSTGQLVDKHLMISMMEKIDRIEVRLASVGNQSPSTSPSHIVMQWRTLACVFDRILFLIFMIFNIINIAVFFPRP